MSKRSYPSGSEKRKKALHQKEVIEKLPKLTSYFTTTTGETSVSSNQLINVPHDDSAQLQIAGISKPSCSNFEKEIESESDYSYDESATTSVTSLKPTTPTVSIEQQFSNTEELISHDPADYFHEKFVEINREILIRKGPVYFQNKDSDFSEASRTYKDGNKLVTRYFNKALFIRKLKNNESVERKWLLYSPSKCSVFCFSCCLFNPTDVNLCSRNGCNDWKHINHIILTHENSPAHKQSMMTYLARSKAPGRRSPPGEETSGQNVGRISIKVPPFYPDKPALWFASLEAQFHLNHITAEQTKFFYAIAQLDTKSASEMEDIIINPPPKDPYTKFRDTLIARFSDSYEEKIQAILIAQTASNLEDLGELADKLYEVATNSSTCRAITVSPVPQVAVTSVSPAADSARFSQMEKQICDLTNVVAQLTAAFNNRRERSRSRSKSRNRWN
ncbi:hypothetical protein ACJJTC_009724 [Scirpophaga incertulas]